MDQNGQQQVCQRNLKEIRLRYIKKEDFFIIYLGGGGKKVRTDLRLPEPTKIGNEPKEILDVAAAAGERCGRRQRLWRTGRRTDARRSNPGDAVPLNWPCVRLMTHLAGAGCSRRSVQPAEFNSLQVYHQVGEFLGNLATLFLRLVVDRGVGL